MVFVQTLMIFECVGSKVKVKRPIMFYPAILRNFSMIWPSVFFVLTFPPRSAWHCAIVVSYSSKVLKNSSISLSIILNVAGSGLAEALSLFFGAGSLAFSFMYRLLRLCCIILEVMAWLELEMDREWRRSWRSRGGERFSKTLSGSLGVTQVTGVSSLGSSCGCWSGMMVGLWLAAALWCFCSEKRCQI